MFRRIFTDTLGKIGIFAIRVYQSALSPLFVPCCRFYPSCSEYAIAAIRQYGPFRGVWAGFRRLLRCHPLHPGGYDPLK